MTMAGLLYKDILRMLVKPAGSGISLMISNQGRRANLKDIESEPYALLNQGDRCKFEHPCQPTVGQ